MKTTKIGATVLIAIGASLALGACADDGYSRGYTSLSVGASTGDYGYRDGDRHRNWGHRDSDRDGVPNRYDPAPHDPYVR